MQGCNNFCTYCVVPYTRGREISRSAADILKEINHLVDNGIKEVTLIGQNVNSYGRDDSSSTGHSFPELLRAVNAIKGLERIRFTTSHPKDLSLDRIGCFAELKKLCTHFHLPVQSGSNRILKRMNRKYLITSYLDKVTMLRKINPEITLTTDIIVGFSGETEEQFEQTMSLFREVDFDISYHARYSSRSGTLAAKIFPDDVSREEKERRWKAVQDLMVETTLRKNQRFLGQIVSVLVDRCEKGICWGNTREMKLASFPGTPDLVGKIVEMKVERPDVWVLFGQTV